MPVYEYKCTCGEEIERTAPMIEMKKRVKCPKCGKMASRAIVCPNAIVHHRLGEARIGRGKGY
jgi:putative FmdB family regulatory protein